MWQDPNGITLESQERVAVEAELLTRAISAGLSLSRGPTRNSPDGEHCCVRVITNERRCVTFSEYNLMLTDLSNINPPLTCSSLSHTESRV